MNVPKLDPPAKLKRKMRGIAKDPMNMTVEELDKFEAETREALADLDMRMKVVEDSDPFWFYQPTRNEVSPEQRAFLSEFLRPEDIPARLDSAMDVHACDANIVGVSGGNQSSKTTTCTIEDLIKACRVIPDSLKGIYPESKLPKKKVNRIRIICEDYQNGILETQPPELDALDAQEAISSTVDGKNLGLLRRCS